MLGAEVDKVGVGRSVRVLNSSVGDVVTANSVVGDSVSEQAHGISSVVVGEALGMLKLATVGSVPRGISSVALEGALWMLKLVTVGSVVRRISSVAVGEAQGTSVAVGPVVDNNTTK